MKKVKIDWSWLGFIIAFLLSLLLEHGEAWIVAGYGLGILFSLFADIQKEGRNDL